MVAARRLIAIVEIAEIGIETEMAETEMAETVGVTGIVGTAGIGGVEREHIFWNVKHVVVFRVQ